jgi:hypothetical protein
VAMCWLMASQQQNVHKVSTKRRGSVHAHLAAVSLPAGTSGAARKVDPVIHDPFVR